MAFGLSPFSLALGRSSSFSGAVSLAVTLAAGGAVEILVAGADFTVTISGSGIAAHNGTWGPFSVTSTLPLVIVPVGASGALTAGTIATAVVPVVLYDADEAEPVFTYEWRRGGNVLTSGPTHTVTSDDESLGLDVVATVIHDAGQVESQAAAIALVPWSESAVQANGGYLVSPDIGPAQSTGHALRYYAFTVSDPFTEPQVMTYNADSSFGLMGYTQGGGLRLGVLTVSGNFRDTPAIPGGSKVHILQTAQAAPGGGFNTKYCHTAIKIGSGAWSSFYNASSGDLVGGAVTLLAWVNGASPFDGVLHRMAYFHSTDKDADGASLAAVQDLFCDADGNLLHPAVSQGVYGTPLFDFNGPAPDWNAGTNDGSATFTLTGASFT